MTLYEHSFDANEGARALLNKGRLLHAVAAGQLEETLLRQPDEMQCRGLLIGYYRRGELALADANHAVRLNKHLGWLIDRDPEHALLRMPV
ncbi:MAG: hypothetical protein V3V20_01285 [Algisphaera sp.]